LPGNAAINTVMVHRPGAYVSGMHCRRAAPKNQ
jgi:hypothetical protein